MTSFFCFLMTKACSEAKSSEAKRARRKSKILIAAQSNQEVLRDIARYMGEGYEDRLYIEVEDTEPSLPDRQLDASV